MRLLCRLFACRLDHVCPFCVRCGAGVYDSDFVQRTWIVDSVQAFRRAISRFTARVLGNKCVVCGKRFRGTAGGVFPLNG